MKITWKIVRAHDVIYYYYVRSLTLNLGKGVSDLQDPRVLFAEEHTLLAWNRTSLALIAFGFLVERTPAFY